MTRAEVRTAIQAAGHGTDTVPAQNTIIAQVYAEIAGDRRWSWLLQETTGLSTTIGDPTYLASATYADIDEVRIEVSTDYLSALERIDAELLREYLHTDRDNGIPRYFAQTRRDPTTDQLEISIYPRPDRVYTMAFYGTRTVDATEQDDDADAAPFDARFHPILVWGALRWLSFRQRDWAAAQYAEGQYQAYLQKMRRADATSKGSSVVEHWPGWDSVKPTRPMGFMLP